MCIYIYMYTRSPDGVRFARPLGAEPARRTRRRLPPRLRCCSADLAASGSTAAEEGGVP